MRFSAGEPEIVGKDIHYIGRVLQLGQHVHKHAVALAGESEVEDVVEADHDHQHAGATVNVAANRFVGEEEAGGRIRIFEREAGDDQGKERDEEQEVLSALALGHAHDHPGSVGAMARMLAAVHQLAHEDHQVMEEHEADHGDDHQDVELAHPGDHLGAEVGLRGGCGIEVDFALGEVGVGAGMALSAGLGQVAGLMVERWIGRGKDVVRTVAGGADSRCALEPSALAMP